MTQRPSIRTKWNNLFFGWKTVIAGTIIACWGYGSWYYGMGALFKPLTEEFGWTRTQLSIAFSMRSVEGGLEGPFGGALIDKYGERRITIISTIIACLGLLSVLFITELWHFIIIWGFVVSLGFNLGLYDTVNSAVAKWFLRNRSRAIGIVTIGGGLGAPIIVPIMTWIIQNYNWRAALIFIVVTTAIIAIPLAWFWMKDKPPEFYGLLPDGSTSIKDKTTTRQQSNSIFENEFTPLEAIKTRSFWTMLIAFMLNSGTLTMVTMHQMAYHTDIGIDALTTAGIIGMMATMSLGGRALTAILGPKFTERQYIILGYTLRASGLLIFTYARSIPLITLFVVLFGIGYGITIPAQTSLRAAYFGRKAYARITGITTLFAALTNIAYPVFAGWTYDVTGNYTQAFLIITGLQAMAIFFMLITKKPDPPYVSADIY